jgi:hypothetical protein
MRHEELKALLKHFSKKNWNLKISHKSKTKKQGAPWKKSDVSK